MPQQLAAEAGGVMQERNTQSGKALPELANSGQHRGERISG
jgi:hypothetical protein